MKKAILILLAMALLGTPAMADGPQYEVTISVVFNSIDHAKAAEIIKDDQERYGDACKVEIKSKKVGNQDEHLAYIGTATTSEASITDGSFALYGYAFGDIGSARIACGDAGVKKTADGEYYECKD